MDWHKFQLGQLVVSPMDGYMGQIVMESGRGVWVATFPQGGRHYRVDWAARLPPELYKSADYHKAVQNGRRPSFYPSPYVAEYGAVIYESWEAENDKLLALAVPDQIDWWQKRVGMMRAERAKQMASWSEIHSAGEMATALRGLQSAMIPTGVGDAR